MPLIQVEISFERTLSQKLAFVWSACPWAVLVPSRMVPAPLRPLLARTGHTAPLPAFVRRCPIFGLELGEGAEIHEEIN